MGIVVQLKIHDDESPENYFRRVRDYARNLEKEGWYDAHIEGGVASPDGSTLFITCRMPYEGELIPYMYGKDNEYVEICKKFVNLGDFEVYEFAPIRMTKADFEDSL